MEVKKIWEGNENCTKVKEEVGGRGGQPHHLPQKGQPEKGCQGYLGIWKLEGYQGHWQKQCRSSLKSAEDKESEESKHERTDGTGLKGPTGLGGTWEQEEAPHPH